MIIYLTPVVPVSSVGSCGMPSFLASASSHAAGSFFMEALIPLGDWRWLVISAIGLMVAWLLWFTDPKRRWQSFQVSHDGREVGEKIRRMPKRHTARVEVIYQAYTNLAPELKQFSKQADYGYWAWLNEHWPDRAVEFAQDAMHLSLYDAWKEHAKYTGIRYARSRSPWRKRVWARLKW